MILFEKITELLKNYDVGSLLSVEKVGGLSNNNFKIKTSNGTYLVKNYKVFHHDDRFESIKIYIETLKKEGIPCQTLILTVDKKLYVLQDGEKWQIFTFIENYKTGFLTSDNLDSFVRMQIRLLEAGRKCQPLNLHKACFNSKNDLTQFYKYNTHYKNQSILEYVKLKDKKDDFDNWVLSNEELIISLSMDIFNIIDKIPRDSLTNIHFDMQEANVLFDKNGNVCAVLDYEFMHYDFESLDIIKSARFYATKNHIFNFEFFNEYIKKYEDFSKTKLDSKIIFYLLLFVILRRSIHIMTRHYILSDDKLLDLAKIDINCIKYLVRNKNEFYVND